MNDNNVDGNNEEEKICVKCGEGVKIDDQLNQIGLRWSKESRTPNPLDIIIDQAAKTNSTTLVSILQSNKETGEARFIHKNCRTTLRNQARPTKIGTLDDAQASSSKRISREIFDFKKRCFYCGTLCLNDSKHPDRKKFAEVRTITSGIHHSTLEICRIRDNEDARNIEARLLGVNDLVAAEARYHIACRANFENPPPVNSTPGRPTSKTKMKLFEEACKYIENDIELYFNPIKTGLFRAPYNWGGGGGFRPPLHKILLATAMIIKLITNVVCYIRNIITENIFC